VRLHSLQVTAFGPFAGTERVDFDALGSDGLFLLHGATGAGKTTVLDAVAFALFGKLPGARQDADGRRLLSDHAPVGSTPRVELELTVGGRRARLVRSPEYQRVKRRGTGTTKENASATLTWLGCPGSAGSGGASRPDEVGREVERLLGMNADQFFQVVLLPQGDFARFLRSDTAERAKLLQRLFDTARFGGAEEWLTERRRVTAVAADAGTREVDGLLGRLCTAAGQDDEPTTVTGPLAWAQQLAEGAHAERDRAAAALTCAQATSAAAEVALRGAVEQVQQVERRQQAQEQLSQLAAQQPDLAHVAEVADAARRAASVVAAADDADQAQRAVAEGAAAVGLLADAVTADRDGAAALDAERAGHTDLTAAGDSWRSEVGRMAELVKLGAAATADAAAAEQLGDQQTALRARLHDIASRLEQLPDQLAAAILARTSAQQATALVPALGRQLQRARVVAVAAARVPQLRREHTRAVAAQSDAVAAYLTAKEHWLDLRERRLMGMAAELAGALSDGEPCTVCGSRSHPRPAQPTQQVVGSGDEQVAHAGEQAAAAAGLTAAARVTAALRELDAAEQGSGGLEPDVAAAAECTAAAEYAEATATATGLAAVQQRCAELGSAAESLAATEQGLHQELATATARRDGLLQRSAEAFTRLEDERGADPDVSTRRARLDGLATTGARLLAARTELASAERVAQQRHARAFLLAADAGFDGLAAARVARRSAGDLAQLDAQLARARDVRAAAQARLAEPEVVALGELGSAAAQTKLGHAQAAAAAAAGVLGRAQGAAATAGARVDAVDALLAQLRERLDVLGPLEAEAQRVRALAEVVAGNGQNSRKVSLHSYVLAARLEEVAVAASRRLRRMSSGRYGFVHSDAAGPNGRRGGLGLDVFDDYTGALRSTKTLSGGESFLASLSLALGLADVVAAESGGVQLDTLFIDEGFGSLDPAALEEVMAVLDELRAGGRVVGLVSHVDELRQRIPNRLYVRSTRTGSHLEAAMG